MIGERIEMNNLTSNFGNLMHKYHRLTLLHKITSVVTFELIKNKYTFVFKKPNCGSDVTSMNHKCNNSLKIIMKRDTIC